MGGVKARVLSLTVVSLAMVPVGINIVRLSWPCPWLWHRTIPVVEENFYEQLQIVQTAAFVVAPGDCVAGSTQTAQFAKK